MVETCKNPNVDIINVAFVNVFPDQGPGGYPGTNFGNACPATTYKHNGISTEFLKGCPDIGPDIITCQKTYGKKILLSLGGGYPLNYYIANDTSAVSFADFLWGAFGPQTKAWTNANKPRPFGNAAVDGFDFDIESEISPPPQQNGETITDYQTRGYAKMIQTFRQVLFKKDTSKSYFISAAPQCVLPDTHFASLVTKVWFDFLFVQFYNTPYCSARTGLDHINGKTSNDISFDAWANISFFNPNAKVYLGLPAAANASNAASNYIAPVGVHTLVKKFMSNKRFGGIMLWEATYGMNNVICGKNYPTWMKQILVAVSQKKAINTSANPCPKIPISKTGRCGPNFGFTCSGSSSGGCCGPEGFCTNRTTNCNSGFSSKVVKARQVSPAEAATSLESSSTATTAHSVALPIENDTASQATSSAVTSPAMSTSVAVASTSPAAAPPTSSSVAVASPSSSSVVAITGTQVVSSIDAQAIIPTTAAEVNVTSSADQPIAAITSSSAIASAELQITSANASVIAAPTAVNASTTPASSLFATAEAQQDAASPTDSAEIFTTVTLYSTVYDILTDASGTQTVTSLIPTATLTTDAASITAAPVRNASNTTSTVTQTVLETVTTCAANVGDCSAHPELRTVTVTKTVEVVHTILPSNAAETVTITSNAHTTIDVFYAGQSSVAVDAKLYNPHDDETSTTTVHTTTTVLHTSVIRAAASRSTLTLTSTYTVYPVAPTDAAANAIADTAPSVNEGSDKPSNDDSSDSVAVNNNAQDAQPAAPAANIDAAPNARIAVTAQKHDNTTVARPNLKIAALSNTNTTFQPSLQNMKKAFESYEERKNAASSDRQPSFAVMIALGLGCVGVLL